ncbi:hypothetical protein HPC49_38185 [Pyxidicoccus fallax]|uniref:Uncharacterized protein n=1 Tax=Pyxidicoccus fallax TaxID=394095 RepID=A0A848LXH6_9BACT|nr:hypothetical protein [Pyxidicoccus fallax]NMO22329.1 hypothetical protein [Pyxidicoccus fallax]NPC84031.1 hypothetical protein [Pyxidicoccus fallax]
MRANGSSRHAPGWGWLWLLAVTLTLTAYGIEPESPEPPASQAEAADVSQFPAPTWNTPSFASGAEVATDGSQTLVVWRDGSRPGEIHAARVSRRGRLLDPNALQLNPAPAFQAGAPAVAFDGRHFLVIWPGEHSLLLVRVQPDGRVLDGPRPIAAISGDPSSTPGIACTWRKCLATWVDFGDPRRIRGVLLKTQDSGVSTREVTLAHTLAISSYGVPVAWSGQRFLVAWSDTRFGDFTPKIVAARVTGEGDVLDPGGIVLSDTPGSQTWVDLVGTRQGFFVAWSDTRGGTARIFGTSVRLDGSIPDPDGAPLSRGPNDTLPSLAYDGQQVFATWSRLNPDRFSIRGNFVRSDGTVATPDGFRLSANEFVREVEQDVVFQGEQYFMAFGGAPTIDEPPFQVILGTRVRTDGTRVDIPALRISHSPSVEGTAALPAP